MGNISISLKLRVLPGDKIISPGCEPSTFSSSISLAKNMDCGRSIIDLADALEAIPGSRVEYITYDIESKKFYVLPSRDVNCRCEPVVDYYDILRSLAKEPTQEEREKFDYCQVFDQGYCPSPDFEFDEPPPSSSYAREGDLSLYEAVRNNAAGT